MILRALLFDLDGTLSNTDPVPVKAWVECLRPYGLSIDARGYRSCISGLLTSVAVRNLVPGLSAEEVHEFVEAKQRYFREFAAGLTMLDGLEKLLAWSKRNALGLGLVTNATRPHAHFMLSKLGLQGFFETEVMGEEVPAGKPDPAAYRIALADLHVGAQEAMAFEDSPSGIRSAVGAGVVTVGIATTQTSEELLNAGASLVIDDFRDPKLWELLDHATLSPRLRI